MSEKKALSPRKHKSSKHKPKPEKGVQDEECVKSGILSKKGHVRKNWKERWFVLRGTTLYYYEKKPKHTKTQPLGMIPIRAVALDSESHKQNTFTVHSVQPSGEKKLFVLRASTHQLMEEWLNVVTEAGKEAQKALENDSVEGSSAATGARTTDPQQAQSASGGGGGSLSASSGSKRSTGGNSSTPSPRFAVSHSSSFSSSGASSDTVTAASSSSSSSSSSRRRGTMRSRTTALSHEEQAGGSANLYRIKFRFAGLLSHLNMLREPDLGNVHFQYAESTIVMHDFVLVQRAPVLSELVESQRKKRRALVVVPESKMRGVTLGSLKLLAEHIYSEQLQLDQATAVDVVDLFVAAKKFELRSVQFHAQLHLRALLSMANVYDVLKRAAHYEAQAAEIKEIALNFAHSNCKLFVAEKEKLKELGLQLFQEVVALALQEYQPLPPLPDPPASTLFQDFEAIYQRTLDSTSIFGGDAYVKIYFEQIRFHKAILSAHCKGFASLLHSSSDGSSSSSSNLLGEDLTQLLNVGSISADGFRTMLKFVYYGDRSMLTPRLACEVAPLANRLLMHDLAHLCHKGMDRVDNTNVLTVLQMTHQNADKNMQALKQKALEYAYEHVLDIDLAPLAQLDASLAVDLLNVFKAHRQQDLHSLPHEQQQDQAEYYEEGDSTSTYDAVDGDGDGDGTGAGAADDE